MAAPDIEGVTEALAEVVEGLSGLAVHNGEKQVYLGPQTRWLATPAAEVIAEDVDLAGQAAGAHRYLVSGFWHVVFYERLTNDREGHERTVQRLVEELLEALTSPGFDHTLGGLTEDLRAVRVTFDVTSRNNQPFRVAAVTLQLEA